jgi:hypothetical protein
MIPYSDEEYLRHRAQVMITPFWEQDKIPEPRLIPYDKVQFLERGISHLRHPSYKHIMTRGLSYTHFYKTVTIWLNY